MMKNGVFCFGISFSRSRDIQVFVQKLMMSKNVHMTAINHKMENISENIGWVLYKLGRGTCNLRQVRHIMIPSMLLPWQPIFAAGPI